jgi:hypothetical protein
MGILPDRRPPDLPGQLLIPGRGFPRPRRNRTARVAYRVSWCGFSAIVVEVTPGRAATRFLQSMRPQYRHEIQFTAIRVVRAPDHDGWARLQPVGSVHAGGDVPATDRPDTLV